MRRPPRKRLYHCCAFAGLVLACVPARSAADTGGPAWLPVLTVASGGGAKGPWRQSDSRYDYVDDGTVAFTQDGGLAVAWADQRRKEVLLRVFEADGRVRTAPVEVSRSPATFSWMPRIAAGGPGSLYLLWQEIIFSGGLHGGEILFARSADGGRSFSPPLNLSRSRAGDGKGRLDRDTWSNGSLDLAARSDGGVFAAWTAYDGALWLARSRDGGRSFMPPQRIAGEAARPARGPSLALGSGGRVVLAWTVGADPDADIRVSQSLDDGASFASARLVGARMARADAPRMALDGHGRLHLVYMEQRGKQPPVIRHARTAGAGADLAFGAPRTLSARGEAASAPQLAVDAQGRVHIAWETARGLHGAWDMRAPAAVPQGGPGPGGRMGSQQGLLGKKLAVGHGMVALANSSLAPGRGSRVWLIRGRLPP